MAGCRRPFAIFDVAKSIFDMLSVKAIYDGNTIQLLEPVDVNSPQEVIITFLRDVPGVTLPVNDVSGATTQEMVEQSPAFSFLNADDEDVYSDADLKVKY
jgi:hypothetical protein